MIERWTPAEAVAIAEEIERGEGRSVKARTSRHSFTAAATAPARRRYRRGSTL